MDADNKNTRKNRMRAAIAWLGTAGLLTFLILTTDLNAAADAFQRANLVMFGVTALISVLITYMTDVATVRFLLSCVGIKVGFGEFARIKGASYLLNIINYNLGLVMMAAIVKKRSSKGWGAAGSPFILLNFIDLSVFSLIVQVAIWTGHSPVSRIPTIILGLMTAGGLVGGPIICIASRWKNAPGRIGKLLALDILAAFRYLSAKSMLLATAGRLTLILEYGVMNFFFMKSFGTIVRPLELLFYMSILAFIALIPISISGIGSTQFAMRDFYQRFVPDSVAPLAAGKIAVVDAFSTAGIFGVLAIRIVIGLVCMPGVSKYLAENPEAGARPEEKTA